MSMLNTATPQLFSDLYDQALPAMPIDPDGILACRLPSHLQKRLSKLSAPNQTGKLTADEQLDLKRFIALEAALRAQTSARKIRPKDS